MSLPPPSHYVVSVHDARRRRRRRYWLAGLWLLSLLVTAFMVEWLDRGNEPVSVTQHRGVEPWRVLRVENAALKQQLANLKRAQQVTHIATVSLRQTLTERDREINHLRADLGFYSSLLGHRDRHKGLRLGEITLQPAHGTHAWHLTIMLIQNIRHHHYTTGKVSVGVDGMRSNRVIRLAWSALCNDTQKKGLPFRFRYFQVLHTTMLLPTGFRPTQLRVEVKPTHGSHVIQTVTWGDALIGRVHLTPGDHHAQS